jgi:hypothetical protein
MITAVHLEGLPQVRAMLSQFEGQELQNKMRKAVRAGAKPFQAGLKVAAATAGHPRSFQKVPAAHVTTRGGASGRSIEAWVRPKSPLFNIFEPGAKAHTIKPGKVHRQHSVRGGRANKGQYSGPGAVARSGGAVLAGPAGSGSWDNTGRKRAAAFFSTKPVRHPGMKARPILEAAFMARLSESEDAIAQAIFSIVNEGRTTGPIS